MLKIADLPITEAVYTFIDSETDTATHIAASSLGRALKRAGAVPILCMIAPSLVAALERGDLGVEEEHALKLSDEALDAPLIVCQWGDKHIIADGAHRLWRRWQRGDQDFNAYYVPELAWRLFTIVDMFGDTEFHRWAATQKVRDRGYGEDD